MTPRKLNERIFAVPALRAQPDQRLVALARDGHESAIEEIVRRYRPALLRYAGSIVSADRADDVVQDSLARALPGIGSGDAELHLRPWLYTIVRNTAFNDLRDAGPPHDHLDENFDGVEQPPQALERREQVRSLLAGLQGLPTTQREALVKREMEGLSHADIGAELGVSVGAARQLIYRARTALREGIGSLIPMPLLRHLLDGGGPSGAAVAGGSAVAVKATVAVLATGAAITAGIAIRGSHHRSSPAPAVAERSGGADRPGAAGPHRRAQPRLTAFAGGGGGPRQTSGGDAGQSGGGGGNLQVGGGNRLQSAAGGGNPATGGGGGDHSGGPGGGGHEAIGGSGSGAQDGSGSGSSDGGASSSGSGQTEQPSSGDGGGSSGTSGDGGGGSQSGSGSSGDSGSGGGSDPSGPSGGSGTSDSSTSPPGQS